jgi:hypothetical protein
VTEGGLQRSHPEDSSSTRDAMLYERRPIPTLSLSTDPRPDLDVSVIIPCRDEAATIGLCVEQARSVLEHHGYTGEVIVVDSGSTDGSADVAREAGARVVMQPIRGYGAACLRGIEAATGRYLVIADGDGTYDLSCLNRFIEPLMAGLDMVLGTRRNGRIERGAMRRRHLHVMEPAVTFLARTFFRLQVSDVRCGLRSFSRDALARLRLGATGMEFASELLVEAARAGLATVEVPVGFRPRPHGPSRRSSGESWRVARSLLLLSPTHLFIVPAILLLAIGLATQFALVRAPLSVRGVTLDLHAALAAGALALLGAQALVLGLFAKTYGLVSGAGPDDAWIRKFNLHYTLERGVAFGTAVLCTGIVLSSALVLQWVTHGAGSGAELAVRPAALAATLIVLGGQVIFASFFLSLLRGSEFGRV